MGDATLGEWPEWTGQAFHLRRRLSEREAVLVGPVKDVRGTPEAWKRADAVREFCPPEIIEEEIGVSVTAAAPLPDDRYVRGTGVFSDRQAVKRRGRAS